jgi:hypothetical protein
MSAGRERNGKRGERGKRNAVGAGVNIWAWRRDRIRKIPSQFELKLILNQRSSFQIFQLETVPHDLQLIFRRSVTSLFTSLRFRLRKGYVSFLCSQFQYTSLVDKHKLTPSSAWPLRQPVNRS